MAKLYFNYSTMNAGKSTVLLQASHNYIERGMQTYLMIARFDDRAGVGRIGSRIGIGADADTFGAEDDLFDMIKTRLDAGPCAYVFLDEAHFMTPDHVWQLARVVDDQNVRVAGRIHVDVEVSLALVVAAPEVDAAQRRGDRHGGEGTSGLRRRAGV